MTLYFRTPKTPYLTILQTDREVMYQKVFWGILAHGQARHNQPVQLPGVVLSFHPPTQLSHREVRSPELYTLFRIKYFAHHIK